MLLDDKELIKTILEEIKIIREELMTMKIVAVKQEQNLKEHMKRSNELERQTELIRQEMKPLQKHVGFVDATMKLVGALSLIATIILAFLEVKKYLP